MSDHDPGKPDTKQVSAGRTVISIWRERVSRLKMETYALYLAYHDPRTPLYARLFVACVVAYAFSPIDLIPDFVPVLGYVDDMILVPMGIVVALKLVPPHVIADCRKKAKTQAYQKRSTNRFAGIVVVAVWLVLFLLTIALVASTFM